jgi:hypothetical protein
MNYTEIAKTELPFDGEFFLSRNKKFSELIFFVHFYDGGKRELLRHIKLVNDLGFDAFAFQLQGDHKSVLKHLPITSDLKFGLKHLYAVQIEKLLNDIPGNKIIFAFSNPSASAIEAMARRHCSDTVAMICDSGPSARFLPSLWNLVSSYASSFTTKPLGAILTPLLTVAWSPLLHRDVHADLNAFPQGFPILSIRGWKDKLISPSHIDEIFEPHQNLDWAKLSLPEAQHLTGLRDFRAEYVPAVENFLKRVATPEESIKAI